MYESRVFRINQFGLRVRVANFGRGVAIFYKMPSTHHTLILSAGKPSLLSQNLFLSSFLCVLYIQNGCLDCVILVFGVSIIIPAKMVVTDSVFHMFEIPVEL